MKSNEQTGEENYKFFIIAIKNVLLQLIYAWLLNFCCVIIRIINSTSYRYLYLFSCICSVHTVCICMKPAGYFALPHYHNSYFKYNNEKAENTMECSLDLGVFQ